MFARLLGFLMSIDSSRLRIQVATASMNDVMSSQSLPDSRKGPATDISNRVRQ